MSRRKRKSDGAVRALLIVLVFLIILLVALLVLRFFVERNATPPEEPYEEILESGVIIRPLQSPELEEEEEEETEAAAPTPVPTPAPSLAPQAEEPQGAVILENHGELEIIVPEDMDSDGF